MLRVILILVLLSATIFSKSPKRCEPTMFWNKCANYCSPTKCPDLQEPWSPERTRKCLEDICVAKCDCEPGMYLTEQRIGGRKRRICVPEFQCGTIFDNDFGNAVIG